MIVVDTSALLAIVLNETDATNCETIISNERDVSISAGTMAEAIIVAEARKVGSQMRALFARFELTIVPVTREAAERAADAYRKWGKGFHPAGLNFGDCFAYALAKDLGCPLLFIGNDFARTDVMRA